MSFCTGGGARGRLRHALIVDSDDFAPIGRFQLQTEDQESGTDSTPFSLKDRKYSRRHDRLVSAARLVQLPADFDAVLVHDI